MAIIEFDPEKDARNIELRGISLAEAEELLNGFLIERIDDRFDYGEARVIATGGIAGRIWVCVYTRRGNVFRVISLRPAKKKERDAYEKAKDGG